MRYNEQEQEESKATVGFKASVDLAMGFLYIVIAIYCFLFPAVLEQFGKMDFRWILGLFGLYGVFRIYRGIMGLRKTIKRTRRESSSR
jgi:hypothetical protein